MYPRMSQYYPSTVPQQDMISTTSHTNHLNPRVMSATVSQPMSTGPWGYPPVTPCYQYIPKPYPSTSTSVLPSNAATVSCNPLLSTVDNNQPSVLDIGSSFSSSTSDCNKCRQICVKSNIEDNNVLMKELIKSLETMRQNQERFETNVLTEMKQMKEVMSDLKLTLQELPIRFADALTQGLESVNNPSDCISINSEPEMVGSIRKISIADDIETDFVDLSNDKQTTETHGHPKMASTAIFEKFVFDTKAPVVDKFAVNSTQTPPTVEKFVFPYDPKVDLNVWLKKETND
ncbi:uncharacterized protein LOC128963836 [Oppia nitens]|uniref:uncharacterized protein LOC128963836 n=1 Tax=Oppia nitens TaxID=1686743 RepID=UPI0023DA9D92|nr:uncharacterized protein LOC128963836 [Oppia nitens]